MPTDLPGAGQNPSSHWGAAVVYESELRELVERECGRLSDAQWRYLLEKRGGFSQDDDPDDFVVFCAGYVEFASLGAPPAPPRPKRQRAVPPVYRLARAKRRHIGLVVMSFRQQGMTWRQVADALRRGGFDCPRRHESLRDQYRRWVKTDPEGRDLAEATARFIHDMFI